MTAARRTPRPESWFEFDFLSEELPTFNRGGSALHSEDQRPILPSREAVSAGKTSRAYNAHSYPTKVPPEAIEPYIAYYTQPGDVVLDPFCGSGMTGLAARRSGRRVVLNDLSPLAAHLAYNHSTRCDSTALRQVGRDLRERLHLEEARHYRIACACGSQAARTRYVIWSDVYACPSCKHEVVLWDHGVDRARGVVAKELRCPSCDFRWRKSAESRLNERPVWAAYACSCQRGVQQRALAPEEQVSLVTFPPPPPGLFVPEYPISRDREMYQRSALHLRGIRTVADLYTGRNLSALAILWEAIRNVADPRLRRALAFAFTNTAWHGTRMRRFNARGGHRPLTGTLYIPQLSSEANVFEVFANKVAHLVRFFAELEKQVPQDAPAINLGSAADLRWLPDSSIDYIFTDPPFGSNIYYADCNLIAEAWLGCIADADLEAVVNRSRNSSQGGKSLAEYGDVLRAAFLEMRRVLRPGRWATVVFQSSDGEVWHAIEAAAAGAGFEVHAANTLDKVQQSMKGYKGRSGVENVASFDIVLHLRAPDINVEGLPRAQKEQSLRSARDLVVKSVLEHLSRVQAEANAERTLPYLYSLSVETLLNAGISVRGHSMDSLRALLTEVTVESDGRWFLTEAAGRAESPKRLSRTRERVASTR